MTRKMQTSATSTLPKLLTQILSSDGLVQAVRALQPSALCRLINHIGLEDAAELVALASTAQLTQVFDEDLWHANKPGQEEHFDAARFGLWLAVLLEAGEQFAAQKLTELPEELVMLAMHQQLLVINLDELAVQLTSGSEDYTAQLEKALESLPHHEFEEYCVIARQHDGWDALLNVLVALDEQHHDFLQQLLARCCHASSEYIADNGGLYEVLTSEQMLEEDAAAAREDRRAIEGYVAPTAATAFLNLARTTPLAQLLKPQARDPLTRAYFRLYQTGSKESHARKQSVSAASPNDRGADSLPTLMQLLKDAAVLPSAQAALQLPEGSSPPTELLLREVLVLLSAQTPDTHTERVRELSYLANVILSGCSWESRRFRPLEAAESALAIANLGLLRLLVTDASAEMSPPQRHMKLLQQYGAEQLFSIGFHILFSEVQLPVGKALLQLLTRSTKTQTAYLSTTKLQQLQRTAQAAITAGRPYSLRPLLSELGPLLPAQTRTVLAGLLEECPRLSTNPEQPSVPIGTLKQLTEAVQLVASLLPAE